MAKIDENDFIEIDFTAKIKNGEIFDSNIKEDTEKNNLSLKAKPFLFSLGHGMFLKSVEDFLIGKETGQEYEISLTPEQGFGKRQTKFLQRIPIKIYRQQNLEPKPGMVFNFDGRFGKVLSVSSGRVLTDFNSPFAGKDLIYKMIVKRKVDKTEEKVKALLDFFFRQEFKFNVNEKEKKVLVEVSEEIKPILEAFSEKFKEIIGFNIEVRLALPNPSKTP